MKHSECKDLRVFDFKEEDEMTDTYHLWSKITNPRSDDDAITKYRFLQHAATGSITQIKEVHTVEGIHVVSIDDDDHGFVSDISCGPVDLVDNSVSKRSEGAISDKAFEQHCHLSEDGVKSYSSPLGMEIRFASPFGPSPEKGHFNPDVPESPSSDGSVGAGMSDSRDSIQESSPSTPAFVLEDNNVPIGGHAQDQSVCGLEMEEMDTVVIHTDYITYCNKCFPASLIFFSNNSIKMKASAFAEEAEEFTSEWEIDDFLSIESRWSSVARIAKVRLHLFTKKKVQAENAYVASGAEELVFSVYDLDWPQRQEEIMSLNTRYKAAWIIRQNGKSCEGKAFSEDNSECSSDPYIPDFGEPFEEVVYPKGDVDAVSISKRDVDLLQPETFINDTIIDFYIKYLKNEIPPLERHRFHFFNSFFFRKLADLDKNPSNAFDSKAAFQRVRKWTRKVNIFDKDYIFIPVNYNLHWSLIVICHPGEVASFNDENIDKSLKVPCILHMDSIRGSHTGLKDLVQSYLLEEWNERQKETSENISSKFINLRFLSLELPQQQNCSDCGLFLLHYAELFIAEAPMNFSPFQINEFDNFLKPEWFTPAEASLKRAHIQRLIYELLESRSSDSASPTCDRELHPSALLENNENENGIEIISDKRYPEKSWTGNFSYSQPVQGSFSYSQPVQGMEMSLLGSLGRTSQCIDDSGLGVSELLEHCQRFDQGSSFGQLGGPMSPIREEAEVDEHLAHSTLGKSELQPIDGACHIGYSPRDFDEGYPWNTQLCKQAEPEGDSSPMSNRSSDESVEMRIIECHLERKDTAGPDHDQNSDESKENVDSLTESYASASSDMMETPPEDPYDLDKIHGSNDEDDPLPSSREELLQESEQELEKNEYDGIVACVDDKVVEDSSSDSDEEQAAKRIRLTPSVDGERTHL